MLDPLERWKALGLPDKPDYAGLLTYAGMPFTRGPDRARRSGRRDRRRADGRPRVGPSRDAVRAAGDPRRQLPAGPHLETRVDWAELLRVVETLTGIAVRSAK